MHQETLCYMLAQQRKREFLSLQLEGTGQPPSSPGGAALGPPTPGAQQLLILSEDGRQLGGGEVPAVEPFYLRHFTYLHHRYFEGTPSRSVEFVRVPASQVRSRSRAQGWAGEGWTKVSWAAAVAASVREHCRRRPQPGSTRRCSSPAWHASILGTPGMAINCPPLPPHPLQVCLGLGSAGCQFVWDIEVGEAAADVGPFMLATRPVTVAEFMGFVLQDKVGVICFLLSWASSPVGGSCD